MSQRPSPPSPPSASSLGEAFVAFDMAGPPPAPGTRTTAPAKPWPGAASSAPPAPSVPPSPGSTALTSTARSDTAPPFVPLETRSLHRHQAHASSAQPVVTLQREGERVVAIRIECGCGQVIELACRYDDNQFAP